MPLRLKAKRGDVVRIGEHTTITISKQGDSRISLVIDAPKSDKIVYDPAPDDTDAVNRILNRSK